MKGKQQKRGADDIAAWVLGSIVLGGLGFLWLGSLAPTFLLVGGGYWILHSRDGRRLRRTAVVAAAGACYFAVLRVAKATLEEGDIEWLNWVGADYRFLLASAFAAVVTGVALSGLREVLAIWLGHPLWKGFEDRASETSRPPDRGVF